METTSCTIEEVGFNHNYQKSDCSPKLILKAARIGNVKLLTYCDTEVRPSYESRNTDEETLAQLGASNGHFNVVEWCLKREKQFFMYALDRFDNTLLHSAAIGGSSKVFDFVAQHDLALLYRTNTAGFTVLHEAAARGHKDVVVNLVQRWNISPDQITSRGNYTAALLAAKNRHTAVLQWLLEWNPSLAHAVAECNYNLLYWTTYNRLRNVTALLCEKYYVQYRDNCDGDFPMHVAYRMGSFRTADVLVDVCRGRQLEGRTKNPRNTVAHEAARKGHLEALKHLTWRNRTYNNLLNDYGQTPMMLAAENFRYATIRYLISRDALANVTDRAGNTILHYTACNPHVSIVKYLWQNREIFRDQLNTRNKAGETSIYKAASCFNLNFIKYLVGKGANLNIATNEKKTALTVAVERNSLKMVEYLIQNAADTQQIDSYGFRPFHYAASEEMKNLIQFHFPEIHMNETPKSTVKPGQVVGNCSVTEAAIGGDLNYITSCYFNKNRGFLKVSKDWTASLVHESAIHGHFNVVQWLLQNQRCLINSRDNANNTLLHAAAQGGSVELVDFVASKKIALLNQQNAAGYSALHVAVAAGHKPVVVRLVEYWKMLPNDTTAITNDTAALVAAKHNRNRILEWLLEKDPSVAHAVGECNNNLLHWTSAWDDTPMVDVLCRKYKLRCASNCDGDFPIHFAFRNSSYELVDVLNQTCGANLLQPTRKFPGNTAAHEAARAGNLDTLEYFDSKIMTRDYINLRNELWQTPVLLAIEGNHFEVVHFLVDVHNVDLRWLDKNDETFLHMLASNKDLRILQYLQTERRDDVKLFLNLANKMGETPLYKATWYGNVPLVRYLTTFLGAYTRIAANDKTAPLLVAIEKEDFEMVVLLSRDGYIKRTVNGSELEAWEYAKTDKMREFVQKTLLCPVSRENEHPLMIDGFETIERERRMVEETDYPVVGTTNESTARSFADTGFLGSTLLLMGTLMRKFLGWKSEFGSRPRHLPVSPRDQLRDKIDPRAIEAVYEGHYFYEMDNHADDNDE